MTILLGIVVVKSEAVLCDSICDELRSTVKLVDSTMTGLLIVISMHVKFPLSTLIQLSFAPQGLGLHGSISVSHSSPENPSGQRHTNSPMLRCKHVAALCWHGEERQLSISSSHRSPVYPEIHVQTNVIFPSVQLLVPFTLQGKGLQLSIISSQFLPVKSG